MNRVCLQVKLCGHATLAAAHFLYTSGLVNVDIIEFSTLSGILTAKRVQHPENLTLENGDRKDSFSIELDFPIIQLTEFDCPVDLTISQCLNGVSAVEILKTTVNDLFVCITFSLNMTILLLDCELILGDKSYRY